MISRENAARHVLFLSGNIAVFTEETALREAPGQEGSSLRISYLPMDKNDVLVTDNSLVIFTSFTAKSLVVLFGAIRSPDSTN